MFNFLNWGAPAPAGGAASSRDTQASGCAGAEGEDQDGLTARGVAQQGRRGRSKDLAWHSGLTDVYGVLWKLIIRPPRSEYTVADLGPIKFRIGTKAFRRMDLQITNDRGLQLECSHFLPLDLRLEEGCSPCVIYLHGNCSSRLEASDVLQVLLPRGLTVFCLDLSGSGLSEGEYISLGWYERRDLKAAVDYLRGLPFTSGIGLWGRSMGAATCVLGAASDWSLGAMVMDSPFSSLPLVAQELVNQQMVKVPGFILNMALQMVREEIQDRARFDIQELQPIRAAPRARSPALFIVAADDDFVLPHHTHDLHRVWGGNERKLLTVTGGHNGARPKGILEEAADFLKDRLSLADALVQTCPPRLMGMMPSGGVWESRREFEEDVRAHRPLEQRIEESSPTWVPTSCCSCYPSKASAPQGRPRGLAVSIAGRHEASAQPEIAAQLVSMGFDVDVAMQVARERSSVDAALELALHRSRQAVRECGECLGRIDLRAPASGALASLAQAPSAPPLQETGVAQQLMALGFEGSSAREAATKSATVEGAVEWLLSAEGPRPPVDGAAQPCARTPHGLADKVRARSARAIALGEGTLHDEERLWGITSAHMSKPAAS